MVEGFTTVMRYLVYILVLFGCTVEQPPEAPAKRLAVTDTVPKQDQIKSDVSSTQIVAQHVAKAAPDMPDASLNVVAIKPFNQMYSTLPEMKEQAAPRHRLSDFAGADTCKKCHMHLTSYCGMYITTS